jgi:hypothetical protein
MTNHVRAVARLTATLVTALVAVGCGAGQAARPQPPLIVARGVAAREPLADPRPYGAADTAFGFDRPGYLNAVATGYDAAR